MNNRESLATARRERTHFEDYRFKHQVNHRKNFVNPDTGAHTNTVLRNWRTLKEVLQFGRRSYHFENYMTKVAFLLQHSEANRWMHLFPWLSQLSPQDQ